jgi:AcrR family transcriptional regulator|tara:strand:+ start:292 stop:675 length:384 start_codon:yes stop_codon:yes gene_type:complete
MPKIVKKTDENARMVTNLSGFGIPHEQICAILNISKPSLYKYYQDELLKGKAQANAKISENLYKIATGSGREAVTACIFWLKTQCNWTEKQVLEVRDDTEQDDKFRKLINDIQRVKLSEEDSNKPTH